MQILLEWAGPPHQAVCVSAIHLFANRSLSIPVFRVRPPILSSERDFRIGQPGRQDGFHIGSGVTIPSAPERI